MPDPFEIEPRALLEHLFKPGRKILEIIGIMHPSENHETPVYAGTIALIGDNCASPAIAKRAVATLRENGIVTEGATVEVQALAPGRSAERVYTQPVQAAHVLQKTLEEQFGDIEVEVDDEPKTDVEPDNGSTLTQLVDADDRNVHLLVVQPFHALRILGQEFGDPSVHRFLSSGRALVLHQEPESKGVSNQWIPVNGDFRRPL